jgi:hypothetical protein
MDDAGNNRHSEEIQAIITKIPSWIVRWGIVIFSSILLMALSVSAIIRYPDTIKLPLKLQTNGSQVNVIALVEVTQDNLTKVKVGQRVLIHLKMYSSDGYAPINGIVNQIANEPNEKGLFTIIIKLKTIKANSPIKFENWMAGTAEIITNDVTVLQRITKNLTKSLN